MSTSEHQPEHKWSDDRPGSHPRDDKLGRIEFAKWVARDLRNWRQKESLVVGINGEWGSGKTMLANLILHYLKEQANTAGESPPIVVLFNPWQWSGQDRLLEGFFSQVSNAFRGNGIADKAIAKKLLRFWEGLHVITAATGEIASRLQQSIVALAALLAGGSGILSGYVTNPTGQTILSWLSVGLLGAAGVCAVYAPVAEKLVDVFKWQAGKSPKSLESTRADLHRELKGLKSSILIVVDDIDRLTKREMRLLVQLVKANADFPNVIYLLLYQKSILADALKNVSGQSGQDFLKKIVQVELDVPVAPEYKMREFFTEQIQPILGRAETRWEKDRWNDLFEEGVWPYFKTPRDIKRFKGSLDFYFDAHVVDDVLEVNPIDLIMVETLRMFDEVAYEAVGRAFQKQRDFLLEHLYFDKQGKDQLTIGIKELLKRPALSPSEQKRLQVILYGLFPQARETFSMADEEELNWKRNLRICHPRFFRRYFQLSGDPSDVTASFVSRLLKPTNDQEKIRKILIEAFANQKFEPLMERLKAAVDDVAPSLIPALLTALLDVSDGLPEVHEGLLSSNAEDQLAGIAKRLVEAIPDRVERVNIFRRAALASQGITGPLICLSLFSLTKEERQLLMQSAIDESDLKSIAADMLPRLWEVARDGRIWKLHRRTKLIYQLRNWAGIDGVRTWLADALKNSEIAMTFLRSMLNASQSTSVRGTRTIFTLLAEHLEQFFDLRQLADLAEPAAKDPLDKAAIATLRKALLRKQRGEEYKELYILTKNEEGAFVENSSDARF